MTFLWLSATWLTHICMRATWHPRIWLRYDSPTCECDMIYSHMSAIWLTYVWVRHDSLTRERGMIHSHMSATWLTHMWVQHDSHTYECDVTHSHMSATWLTHTWARHDSLTRLAHIWVQHDSLTYECEWVRHGTLMSHGTLTQCAMALSSCSLLPWLCASHGTESLCQSTECAMALSSRTLLRAASGVWFASRLWHVACVIWLGYCFDETRLLCVTWLIRICDRTPSCARSDFFVCAIWHMNEFVCATWLIHMSRHDSLTYECDMTHSYVVCATWLIHMWYSLITSYVVCATWLIHMSYSFIRHIAHMKLICSTWLINMCGMTHTHVWHDSFKTTL